MELLKLFSHTGTASTLIYLSLTGIAGVLLGKIRFFNIKLGNCRGTFYWTFGGPSGCQNRSRSLTFCKRIRTYFIRLLHRG